jgi:hypothetical protein
MTRRLLILALLALFVVPLLSACSSGAQAAHEIKLAPLSDMPEGVRRASTTVVESYQFAVANPEILKEIPCYCGCGPMGHASNYACYVQSDAGGEVVFDAHALGCSICVDITVDTMRMMKEGKPFDEIKTTIDRTYSQFGPSNMED